MTTTEHPTPSAPDMPSSDALSSDALSSDTPSSEPAVTLRPVETTEPRRGRWVLATVAIVAALAGAVGLGVALGGDEDGGVTATAVEAAPAATPVVPTTAPSIATVPTTAVPSPPADVRQVDWQPSECTRESVGAVLLAENGAGRLLLVDLKAWNRGELADGLLLSTGDRWLDTFTELNDMADICLDHLDEPMLGLVYNSLTLAGELGIAYRAILASM